MVAEALWLYWNSCPTHFAFQVLFNLISILVRMGNCFSQALQCSDLPRRGRNGLYSYLFIVPVYSKVAVQTVLWIMFPVC
jgi:hypothetical protein